MTSLGWLFLTVSLTFVWGLAIWCFYRVLTLPPMRPEGDREVPRA